jgi:hypothetical protein
MRIELKRQVAHVGLAAVLCLSGLIGFAAALPGPTLAEASCQPWQIRTEQKDKFATPATNYRVHGILRHNWCQNEFFLAWGHQYYYYQDVRNCDGCAGHNVDTIRITTRAWQCGDLFHSTVITKYNFWWVAENSPWSDWVYCPSPQADETGFSKKNGVYSYSWYLNY